MPGSGRCIIHSTSAAFIRYSAICTLIYTDALAAEIVLTDAVLAELDAIGGAMRGHAAISGWILREY
ncbi:hypothetical protein [Cupriavidus sp. AcVe19-1a]|uniref:hypothetical protein n=1 Tax=Cupriavidus sp. AcVe19-1a TaxID=2821359 RepID=UPI001AE260EE|nr:hypothetical protein [Cupriavidus sp. AcVe19-1a]